MLLTGTAYEPGRLFASAPFGLRDTPRPTPEHRVLDPFSITLAQWLAPHTGTVAEMEAFLGRSPNTTRGRSGLWRR
jgi:hypothetical protein